MNKCKLMGLDTSTTITGWSLFENGIYVNSDILFHDFKKLDPIIRVEDMCIDIVETLNKYTPDIIAIERPPFCNDASTLINLSEIVGVVKGWSLTKGFCEYLEYPPNEWRRLVADEDEKIPIKRNDCKIWDKMKFTEKVGREPIDDNEADAYLVGLARINQINSLMQNGKAV